MGAKIDWDDFWVGFKGSETNEAMLRIATALSYGGPFREWVATRTEKVQIEVLHEAPVDIIIGYCDVLSDKVIMKILEDRPLPDKSHAIESINKARSMQRKH